MKTFCPICHIPRIRQLFLLAALLLSVAITAPSLLAQGLTADPLTAAVRDGNPTALAALLREQVSVERKNAALKTAAACNNGGAVAALLAARAQVNHRNAVGFTPLLYAAIRGDAAVVDLLLAEKATVDLASESGLTPLMAAAEHGHVAVLRRLIQAKAAISRQNEPGQSAIDLAMAAGHGEVAEILRAAGAVEGHPQMKSEREPLRETPAVSPLDERITIAMAPFESADYSYQCSLAAEDFAAMLQIALQENCGGTWIERVEIQKVLQEMELQAFSLRDATHGLQLGKLTKADLLVKGCFGVDEGHGRPLHIEIIDVPHADVLADTSIVIGGALGAPLMVETHDVRAASELVAAALTKATRDREKMKNKTRIVPVFFRNVSENSGRLDFLESEIQAAFGRVNDARIRVLQLPRAETAAGESELILAGLAEYDPDLWQRLAEVHVWGEFCEIEPTDLPFEDVSVRLTLHVCTAGGEVDTLDETFSVKTRNAVLKEVVGKAIEAAAIAPKQSVVPAARTTLATSLLARAVDAQKRFPDLTDQLKQTPSGQRRWRYRLGLLETACFLDPGSEDIQRELMIERWNRGAFYTTTINYFTGRHFQGMWRQSLQWRKFVDRFGIDALDRIPHDPATLSKLPQVSSSLRGSAPAHQNIYLNLPAQVSEFISRQKSGFPEDLPAEVRLKWLDEVARDFQKRLKSVAEKCPEKFAIQLFPLGQQALWFPDAQMRADTFGLLWKLGQSQKEDVPERENFQNLLRDAYRLAGREQEASQILAGTRNPPTSDRNTAAMKRYAEFRRESADHLKEIARPHPLATGEVESGFRAIDLSESLTIESAYLVFHSRDGFWAIARQRPPYASVLWHCDPKDGVPVAVDSVRIPGHQKFTCGMTLGEQLWLGADGAGVFRFDTKSRKLDVFDHKSGLPTETIRSCARVGSELFFGGGTPEAGRMGVFDQGSGTWRMMELGDLPQPGEIVMLATQQHRLFAAGISRSEGRSQRNYRAWDTRTRRWSDLGGVIPTDATPHLCAGDDSGIWLASQGKLAHLDLATRTHTPLFELRNRIFSLLPDGDFLWLATANTAPEPATRIVKCNTRIYLIHKTSRKILGYSSLPFNAPVDSMAASETKLCLGLRSGFGDSNALVEMDKAPLLSNL